MQPVVPPAGAAAPSGGPKRALSKDAEKLLDDGFKQGNKAINDQFVKMYDLFATDDQKEAKVWYCTRCNQNANAEASWAL